MRYNAVKLITILFFILLCIAVSNENTSAEKSLGDSPFVVPKTWDEEAIATLDVPLVKASHTPIHTSAAIYYSIPARPFYKSYPVYAPGKEPPGYMEMLAKQEPEIVFDASKLKTEADWVKAGEMVFDVPITFNDLANVEDVRNPAWYQKTGVLAAKDGTVPYVRYVIKEKGKVELGDFSCAMCHNRVMSDGSVIKGAQGNFPFDRVYAHRMRAKFKPALARYLVRVLFAAPWLEPDPHQRVREMSIDEIATLHEAVPAGVMSRFGSSLLFPPAVPDLIGVKDRRYLNHTGHMRQRSIEDLMRYTAIVQDAEVFDRFGDFTPLGRTPNPAQQSRYSDEQLYALSLYLYSLKPPPNPNKFTALAARGQKIFNREGCGGCHTPPLYTNNKLTPVDGFKVPEDHLKRFDILPISVGTDPNLALNTRRGTGYYKVPSLKGVWYRGPFGHSGFVQTLEEWFDPRRTSDSYVASGFRGAGVTNKAVKGHPFGLELSPDERKALIAFLKTL
jgi:hypothetical protein